MAQPKVTPAPSTGPTVPPLFNAPIFLWFLSSVVLGGISFLYNYWQKDAETERIKQERETDKQRLISRLDTEIAARLSYVAAVANVHISREGKPASGAFPESAIPSLRAVNSPQGALQSALVFPEYSSRTLRSLLWELASAVNPDAALNIRDAYEATGSLLLLDVIDADVPHSDSSLAGLDPEALLERLGAGDPEARKIVAQRQLKASANNLIAFQVVKSFNQRRWGCPFSILKHPLVQIYADKEVPSSTSSAADSLPVLAESRRLSSSCN